MKITKSNSWNTSEEGWWIVHNTAAPLAATAWKTIQSSIAATSQKSAVVVNSIMYSHIVNVNDGRECSISLSPLTSDIWAGKLESSLWAPLIHSGEFSWQKWNLTLTLSKWIMLKAEKESRPEVGSSRKSKDGSVINSTPTLVLLRCPPEIPIR